MIRLSKQPIRVKGLLKIGKLVFFLSLYLHCLACFYFMVTLDHSPNYLEVPEDGAINYEGVLIQESLPDEAKNRSHFFYGKHTYAEYDDWDRMGPDVLNWKGFNSRWESRSSQWNPPTCFVDYLSCTLYSNESTPIFRYLFMVYYAILNLGNSEVSPINLSEKIFIVITMIISSMVFTNTFSSIISARAAIMRSS